MGQLLERRMYQTATAMMITRTTTAAMILLVVIAVVIRLTLSRASIQMFIGGSLAGPLFAAGAVAR